MFIISESGIGYTGEARAVGIDKTSKSGKGHVVVIPSMFVISPDIDWDELQAQWTEIQKELIESYDPSDHLMLHISSDGTITLNTYEEETVIKCE